MLDGRMAYRDKGVPGGAAQIQNANKVRKVGLRKLREVKEGEAVGKPDGGNRIQVAK